MRLGLSIFGFARVDRFAARHAAAGDWCPATTPRPKTAGAGDDPQHVIDRLIRAVEVASLRVPGCANCLVRALAAQSLLSSFGYRAQLKIGVRRDSAGAFTAHAWLEIDGRPLLGDFELQRHTVLLGRECEREA